MEGVGTPVRVQLRRTKGWRMPEDTVKACRPGIWGNHHPVVLDELRHTGDFDEQDEPVMEGPWLCKLQHDRLSGWWFATKRLAVAKSIELFRWDITESPVGWAVVLRSYLPAIRGKNLACWCHLCERHKDGKPFDVECADCDPCHVDVLGPLANTSTLEREGGGRDGVR